MNIEVYKNQKKLKCGYTTGSCAAAAAKAATYMLLSGNVQEQVEIDTPKGIHLMLVVENPEISETIAKCAIKKDSGDDPDVTNGMLIFASVCKNETKEINVTGGKGIGKITKPGLSVGVGKSAINPVPMKMIIDEVKETCKKLLYEGGLDIVISAPEGEKIAEKTFNPRLGIIGGISILGTSGIVEPMSEKAILDTIYVEMKQQAELGNKNLLMCPGNYGRDFIQSSLNIDVDHAVKCSNFIGESIDYAVELGFDSILLIGHIGKLIKVAAGVMDTHSRVADARLEVLGLYAALCGADVPLLNTIMDCVTTDEAIKILKQNNLLKEVFDKIIEKMEEHLVRRAGGNLKIASVIFSNEYGILGMTSKAQKLINIQKG